MSRLATQLRELQAIIQDVTVNGVAASIVTPSLLRSLIYRLSGLHVETLSISPRCTFVGRKVLIKDKTFVNRGVYFDASNNIEIGSNCAIGMEVMFCTSNHVYDDPRKRAGNVKSAPIVVKDGCWIGARACIMPGVTSHNERHRPRFVKP